MTPCQAGPPRGGDTRASTEAAVSLPVACAALRMVMLAGLQARALRTMPVNCRHAGRYGWGARSREAG